LLGTVSEDVLHTVYFTQRTFFIFAISGKHFKRRFSSSKAQRNGQQAHAVPTASVGKISVPWPPQLSDITDCPDTSCGPSLDPFLNRQKNIHMLDGDAEPMTLKDIRDLLGPFQVSRSEARVKT
jgi:hypothetical protein